MRRAFWRFVVNVSWRIYIRAAERHEILKAAGRP